MKYFKDYLNENKNEDLYLVSFPLVKQEGLAYLNFAKQDIVTDSLESAQNYIINTTNKIKNKSRLRNDLHFNIHSLNDAYKFLTYLLGNVGIVPYSMINIRKIDNIKLDPKIELEIDTKKYNI
jgi:hypothetical protein